MTTQNEPLEERLQREMREKYTPLFKMFPDVELNDTFDYPNYDFEDVMEEIDDIISHTITETLKAAVSAIEGEKKKPNPKDDIMGIALQHERNNGLDTAITAVEGVGKNG